MAHDARPLGEQSPSRWTALNYCDGIVDNAEEQEYKVTTRSSSETETSTNKASIQHFASPCKENDNPNEIVTSNVKLTLNCYNPNEIVTFKVKLTFIISHNLNVYI